MIPTLTNPLVSIVVPVFNAKDYVDACLDSLCTQDFNNIEVIAVNDGSTDGSGNLLIQRATHDPRVIVLTHPGNSNRGVAASRNLGLSRARGAYLWFVDADDRVLPGAVSRLLDVAQERSADVVAFNAEESGAGLRPRRIYQKPKPVNNLTGEAWFTLSCAQKECPHHVWLRFYRHAYLKESGLQFREGIVHEDIAWITEGDLRARHFVYCEVVLYEYLRNPQSITGSGSDTSLMRRAESMFDVVDQLRDINARLSLSAETRNLLRAEWVGQGLQVDRLRRGLTNPAMRKAIDDRLKRTDFWRVLWKDATRLTRKRQLAQVMLRDLFQG